jgi:hypothetical protein
MLDLTKPIRRQGTTYDQHLRVVTDLQPNPWHEVVVIEYHWAQEGKTGWMAHVYKAEDLERVFENVPEAKESWEVAMVDGLGRPYLTSAFATEGEARAFNARDKRARGVIRITHDGTKLTAEVLPAQEPSDG